MPDVDVLLPLLSIAMVAAYHVFLAMRVRARPDYTMQSFLSKSRAAWIERIMTDKEGILGVQTLRNTIMGATFFASTAVALIVGTITLSTQGDRLSQVWASTAAVGSIDQHLWFIKIVALLVDLMCAFVFFSQSVRLNAHVGVLIGVPAAHLSPRVVARLFIRAGRYHTWGMRCYYLATPMVFWLFGPIPLFVSAIALVAALYFLDRSPLRAE